MEERLSSSFSRHDFLMDRYIKHYGDKKIRELYKEIDNKGERSELDIIRARNKFLMDDDEIIPTEAQNLEEQTEAWEKRVARKYYDKLFKEFCLADLSRYKTGQLALRWRTQVEVITGKGQKQCGNLHCPERKKLKTWEVNFGYYEEKVKKNALVKLCLCPICSKKLNFIKPLGKEVI